MSLGTIALGLYGLIVGRLPDGDLDRCDRFWVIGQPVPERRYIYGTEARISAILIILGGIILGYDVLICVAYMLLLVILKGFSVFEKIADRIDERASNWK